MFKEFSKLVADAQDNLEMQPPDSWFFNDSTSTDRCERKCSSCQSASIFYEQILYFLELWDGGALQEWTSCANLQSSHCSLLWWE